MQSMTIMNKLKDKDDKEAYACLKEMLQESESSDQYYYLLKEFIVLTEDERSYVRVRGFLLACAQYRWDKEGILKKNLDVLLTMLDDEKPSAVRQCLKGLMDVVGIDQEIDAQIEKKLERMNLRKYKESMSSLIEKDIRNLRAK